jgi:thermostable 8-oxoguanine DNA glycosylase
MRLATSPRSRDLLTGVVEDAVVVDSTDALDLVATTSRPKYRAPNLDIEAAWRLCSDLFCQFRSPPPPSHDDVERELLFCLLGGFGISFEHALSACERLTPIRPFASGTDASNLEALVRSELERPQFMPLRQDGTYRRYRYPVRKAKLIAQARSWLLARPPLLDEIGDLPCEHARRRLLCECPGLGAKTASWLLRNLGLAKELAIVDVHLLRALRAAGRIENVTLPRDYELVEAAFLDWCRDLDAPAAAFDLFVWEWQRGSLVASS